MFVVIYRTSKFALQNFWRNLWLSVITIFILVLTLFTISLVATINLLADQALQAIQEKVDIDLYFRTDVAEAEILKAKIYLESLPDVKAVRYVSSAEALDKFAQQHQADPDITDALQELSNNPLPPTLIIQATTLDGYQRITAQFDDSEYAAVVQDKNFSDHQVVIERLSQLIDRIYQAGIIISAIFIMISIIMMYNTIRLAIYGHREELAIMKLVGATNWFIRAPFILESLLYALFSSMAAMVLLSIVTLSAAPYINNFFTGYNFSLNVFFYSNFWTIFLLQFLFSVLLAAGSSMLSIGKYLKV